ncbi:DUF1993 domain-containing protein [Ideonella alba]|uniref:DUF1993 domain-containing protein n=1 Tax=Ideonella alba TaxID=2824118 RepID=A0A940YAH9_9BURK|nr:DUF1993 domain-containing protein [Ideonella alba]MBQ0931596.1 DUF1993 domain-containing protein [Ideonella alba]
MSITLGSAALPTFTTALGNLAHLMDKAEANAAERKFNPDVFCTLRFAPDMLPFTAQIRIACDAAKNGTARLAGIEAPKFEDNETTFAELKARVAKTLAWLATVQPSQLDGREAVEITFPVGRDATRTMTGQAYLLHWAIPNIFFHVTTAYDLLRQAGVPLGKADYLVGPSATR